MPGKLSRAELLDIQAEFFAEDVPLTEAMCSWTIDEVTTYFESGGRTAPLRAANKPAGAVTAVKAEADARAEAEARDRTLALQLQEAEERSARRTTEQLRHSGPTAPPPQLVRVDWGAQEARELERAIQQSIQDEQRAERQRQLEEEKALEAALKLLERQEKERKALEMAALRERSAVNERKRADEEKVRQQQQPPPPPPPPQQQQQLETGGPAAASSDVSATWASVDSLTEALARLPASLGGSGGGGAVRTGVAVGEWANCELLMPLLTAVMPSEAELEAVGVVVIDIPTAQLLKLADADQQCEAVIDGPQCASMRRRMANARLILALINDNDDPELMDGGRHWSAVAMRREAWRGGVCRLEHYDPSGDHELNCDAAQQLASSLTERLSEIRQVDADRIEVWRMAAPAQHAADVCGLTAIAYLRALVEDVIEASSPTATAGGLVPSSPSKAEGGGGRGDSPSTPTAVARLTWREVEGLRQAAARSWAPECLEAAEAYASLLSSRERPARHASAERHVVFDLHAEEEDGTFDELVDDRVAIGAVMSSAALQLAICKGKYSASAPDVQLYDFLQAVGLGAMGSTLGRTGLTLATCAEAVGRDRTQFLADLRDAGVTKLSDRQGFANALGRARREGWLHPPYKGPFTAAGRELRNARVPGPSLNIGLA
jgi:hypothetical protein